MSGKAILGTDQANLGSVGCMVPPQMLTAECEPIPVHVGQPIEQPCPRHESQSA